MFLGAEIYSYVDGLPEKKRARIETSPAYGVRDGIQGRYSKTYCRLRGPKISQERAADLISRIDLFLCPEQLQSKSEEPLIVQDTFRSESRREIMGDYFDDLYQNWIHPDGSVACNFYTDKLISYERFVDALFRMVDPVPNVEFVICVSGWPGLPLYVQAREQFIQKQVDTSVGDGDFSLEYLKELATVEEMTEAARKLKEEYPVPKTQLMRMWEKPDVNWWELQEENFKESGWLGFVESLQIGFYYHDRKIEIIPYVTAGQLYCQWDKENSVECWSDRLDRLPSKEFLEKVLWRAGVSVETFYTRFWYTGEGIQRKEKYDVGAKSNALRGISGAERTSVFGQVIQFDPQKMYAGLHGGEGPGSKK